MSSSPVAPLVFGQTEAEQIGELARRAMLASKLLRPLLRQFPEESRMWWDARKVVDRLDFDERELLGYVRLVDPDRATGIPARLESVESPRGNEACTRPERVRNCEFHFLICTNGGRAIERRSQNGEWCFLAAGAVRSSRGDQSRADKILRQRASCFWRSPSPEGAAHWIGWPA